MAAVSQVITRGYGLGGTQYIPTRGYTPTASPSGGTRQPVQWRRRLMQEKVRPARR